jgi:cytochrome P450/CYTH domain-containing protein
MDEFRPARAGDQQFTLILRYDHLKHATRDWTTFTSATPFRVPIPEESALRPVRQYPIETDPPEHGAYRRLVDRRFSRSAADAHRPAIAALTDRLLADALDAGELHVVDRFAIPIVAHAIALTMGLPGDTDRLVSWGLHVFRDPVTHERRRNDDLDAYLAERVDAALAAPGDDIFGDLARAELDGRRLTRDELLGYGYLVLAGGRDTVIASIAGALWHLAHHPDEVARLRADPTTIPTAVEEFLRYLSPLAHIGRTVATGAELGGHRFEQGELVSLCFAAANRDPDVFEAPDECRLDRRPNRHVAFGHGPHTCLGAPLARMELTVVLERFLAAVTACSVLAPHRVDPPARSTRSPPGRRSPSTWCSECRERDQVIERERRFLVATVPADLPPPQRIEQAYLTTAPVAVRVRRAGDRFVLTIKSGAGRNRVEIERDLDADEFSALWEVATELRIEKRRHRIELDGGAVAELDLFDGDLAGNRIVEVEFDDDAAADDFTAPSWFDREVTDDSRYTNASLARHGWPAE